MNYFPNIIFGLDNVDNKTFPDEVVLAIMHDFLKTVDDDLIYQYACYLVDTESDNNIDAAQKLEEYYNKSILILNPATVFIMKDIISKEKRFNDEEYARKKLSLFADSGRNDIIYNALAAYDSVFLTI